MGQAGIDISDIIPAARGLTATEKTKQVTNAQIGGWANDGLSLFYDEMIKADPSYASVDVDLTFGSGTQAARTASLPDDCYRIRALRRFPDTPAESPVFPITTTDASRKFGYILRGRTIQLAGPAGCSIAGTYRLTYATFPPRFGRVLDITTSADDGLIDGSALDLTLALSCKNGGFTAADDGSSSDSPGGMLVLYGCQNASANNAQFPLGGYPLRWSGGPSSIACTSSLIGIEDPATGMAAEAFSWDTIAMIVHTGEITSLPLDVAPYNAFISCYCAARIMARKQWPITEMEQLMSAEVARYKSSLPLRESEPECAPVLWRPSCGYYRY